MIPNLNETQARIREEDLVVPALLILAKAEHANHGPITTTQLKTALKEAIELSDEDRAPLKNRPDTKIDQIIRNLVSHRTLTRKEWVHQENGMLSITEAGKAQVLDSFLELIPAPSFTAKATETAALDQASTTDAEAPRTRRRPGM